ncbi:hypothetical protein Lgee_0432 [Legionella geestiana]|uniref:UPF0276 protein Lgee_0432 n=1 Tax=Legionella geestiana TaxID=45065 RepID=A0A0W0U7P4_9GAMM|nr:DUF692 domain-containing protein [Legionella geestiana]KTD03775.1 hypothetical protein Lgee_0432 [Legionella geestiana]QBS11939.1 DUF692 domain-containing protein [Legionella geestiana]QDQ40448.1 DUF692 domain-containing protein [Legionella geestiana]STX53348.1 Protein of uncharacterised function (DUF692) [Legionella geestiana]
MKTHSSGFGLGLRPVHYEAILQHAPKVDWFEAISENYMVPGGKPLYYLDKIRERYPIALHGVSLSIGSTDPLDFAYLEALRKLINRVQPVRVSDHLCWTGVQSQNMHDLLPLPFTEDAIRHIVPRIRRVQDAIGQPLLLENVSSYVTWQESAMTEWEFLRAILEEADCLLLLDVNNVYVSAINHGFNPCDYLNALPRSRVAQIHLAGHSHHDDCLIDTHDQPIVDAVWSLYTEALQRFGFVPTMIERDDNIPPLETLLAELERVRDIAAPFVQTEVYA